jgi:hypothetical protein
MEKESCYNCGHKEVCWMFEIMSKADQTDNAEKLRSFCAHYFFRIITDVSTPGSVPRRP